MTDILVIISSLNGDGEEIHISQLDNTNNYAYTISNGILHEDYDGVIFNHIGSRLELLEKILHGRNMS